MNQGADQPQREAQIPSTVNLLNRSINTLEEVVDLLICRMPTVLREETPTPVDPVSKDAVEESMAPLACETRVQNSRVLAVVARLRDIETRLEL